MVDTPLPDPQGPGPSDLVNDVLLAMTAVQIGATLFTCNGEDFRLIARHTKFPLEIL